MHTHYLKIELTCKNAGEYEARVIIDASQDFMAHSLSELLKRHPILVPVFLDALTRYLETEDQETISDEIGEKLKQIIENPNTEEI